MREIIYRCWDEENKNFAFSNEPDHYANFVFENDTLIWYFGEDCGEGFRWVKSENDVEAYTGLKDKNGNRIFEGDRLNCWRSVSIKGDLRGQYYKPLVVSYSEYLGMFILEDTEIKESYQLKHFEVIEIIGNIHDKD